MKTSYYDLWKRASKHLNDDIADLHSSEEIGERSMKIACSLSGMTNAYYAIRYLIMDVLQRSDKRFSSDDDLELLIDTLLSLDKPHVTEDDIKWAYDMEYWESVSALRENGEPYNRPLTYKELKEVYNKLFRLKDILDEGKSSES